MRQRHKATMPQTMSNAMNEVIFLTHMFLMTGMPRTNQRVVAKEPLSSVLNKRPPRENRAANAAINGACAATNLPTQLLFLFKWRIIWGTKVHEHPDMARRVTTRRCQSSKTILMSLMTRRWKILE